MRGHSDDSRSWAAGRKLLPLSAALLLVMAPAAFAVAPAAASSATVAPLRVCAESDNMPFSDRRGEGFENRVATFLAARLGRPVQYVWLASDVDLASLELKQSTCDAVIAEPSPASGMDTTVPYYLSSYVLVSRSDRHLDITTLKDPRLHGMRIGVESLGRPGFYTPPERVLIDE